jgi:hypothetical protein
VVTVRAYADKMVAAAVAGSPYAPPSNDAVLAAVQSLQANMNERFLALEGQFLNLNARAANDAASENGDTLAPLRSSAGSLPPAGMPATLGDLRTLSGHGVDPLLAFYGLATSGNVQKKRNRLARYLGVRNVHGLTEES